MRILILTTHTGGGHLNLAQSLQDMLEADYETLILDPQPALVDRCYALVSRYCLRFLSWQYTATDNARTALWLQRLVTLFSRKGIRDAIERSAPDLLIVTHAHLAYAVARVNACLPRRLPLVFQLTDLGCLHSMWFVEKQADAYLAPSREIFAQCLRHGIAAERLYFSGRPVRRQFLEVYLDQPERTMGWASEPPVGPAWQPRGLPLHFGREQGPAWRPQGSPLPFTGRASEPGRPQESPLPFTGRAETLVSLGFAVDVFTIFLQGGAKGSAGVERTIEGLLRSGTPLQIILATGNNGEMAARYATNKQVRAVPFTPLIAPYMAAADVVAGKAGASFITEAFILHKPFVVTTYIPGQETPNLRFIEQHNLGWVCLEAPDQVALLLQLAGDPSLLDGKVESIRSYRSLNLQANQQLRPLISQLMSSSVSDAINCASTPV